MTTDASATRTGSRVDHDARSPEAALRTLDRLVGTWRISGPDGLTGEVRYEWMDGGGFLVQHVDLHSARANPAESSTSATTRPPASLRSHFSGAAGELLEYTYRIDGDRLLIWFGGTDSPARFEGVFGSDDTTNSGAWRWPGGGYESTMTRVA